MTDLKSKGASFHQNAAATRGVGKNIGERRVWQENQSDGPSPAKSQPRDLYARGTSESLQQFPANATVQRGARRFAGANPYQHPLHYAKEAGLKGKAPLSDEQSLRICGQVIDDERLHTPRAISKAVQSALSKKRLV